jgi:hypothetical protein
LKITALAPNPLRRPPAWSALQRHHEGLRDRPLRYPFTRIAAAVGDPVVASTSGAADRRATLGRTGEGDATDRSSTLIAIRGSLCRFFASEGWAWR